MMDVLLKHEKDSSGDVANTYPVQLQVLDGVVNLVEAPKPPCDGTVPITMVNVVSPVEATLRFPLG
jgi:hypothetical protein